ncbi:MAG: hypothetical protein E7354_00985 [Clostridiales bacterium]|nr:hypothetical protein [Clostridiales bacterium]
MKKNKLDIDTQVVETFDEYKKLIDTLIENNQLRDFHLSPRYYEISRNRWLIDQYIARGGVASEGHTENTLSAYNDAIKNKYAISLPVRMIDDGSIVCFAHKTLSKVISTESGYIINMSLSELKNLNLNADGEKILTLDEALEAISNKCPIIIDIKNDGMVGKIEESIITTLDNYIKEHKAFGNVAIMSCNPYTLEYMLQNYPYVPRILKSGKFENKMYGSIPTKKLTKLKLYKITSADFICYSHEDLPYRAIKKYKPAGVLAHTVTSQTQYLRVAPYCDNVIFTGFKPYI